MASPRAAAVEPSTTGPWSRSSSLLPRCAPLRLRTHSLCHRRWSPHPGQRRGSGFWPAELWNPYPHLVITCGLVGLSRTRRESRQPILDSYLDQCSRKKVRIRIITEVCSTLIFLHKHKPHPVVHGDLKPGNILLDVNLLSKLSDFGISRLLLESSVTGSDAHFTSQPMGTPAYMDPEFFGTGELTPQSDTYSFGVTILCLLTGRMPLRLTTVVQEALNADYLHSVLDHSAGE